MVRSLPRPASRDNGALRTTKKYEADFFFVPSYVKCVHMLNDKEINQTYVKVLSQMPYFRRSGGRDHISIFPSGAGAHLFRSWATYLNRSIILTPEVGYLLGLGDWHPSYLMLHRSSGKILHIDFGDCFEASMNQEKFPEKVPFRLTRMLVNAMEVSGIEGNFRSTCENVMQVLRTNKDSVMVMMEGMADRIIGKRTTLRQNLEKLGSPVLGACHQSVV